MIWVLNGRGQKSAIVCQYQEEYTIKSPISWTLLPILEEGKIIINFDESQVQGSKSKIMIWVNPKHSANHTYRREISGLSLHLAISSKSGVYIQFLQDNNNDTSVAAFIIGKERALSSTSPDWTKTHVLLLDNCASHKIKQNLSILKNVGFTVIFSAPPSFKAIPFNQHQMSRPKFEGEPRIQLAYIRLAQGATVRQTLMAMIANYLIELKVHTVMSFFSQRFVHLSDFAGHVKV